MLELNVAQWSAGNDYTDWVPSDPWPVRVAGAGDQERLFDVLDALYRDNPVTSSYSPAKVRECITRGTVDAERYGGMIGVIDAPNGDIAATIGIFPHQPWFSDDVMLHEHWLFVRPEYRRHGLHARLFEFAKAYRREMEAQLGRTIQCTTGVVSEKRLRLKIRLWSRFARQIGAVFALED